MTADPGLLMVASFILRRGQAVMGDRWRGIAVCARDAHATRRRELKKRACLRPSQPGVGTVWIAGGRHAAAPTRSWVLLAQPGFAPRSPQPNAPASPRHLRRPYPRGAAREPGPPSARYSPLPTAIAAAAWLCASSRLRWAWSAQHAAARGAFPGPALFLPHHPLRTGLWRCVSC